MVLFGVFLSYTIFQVEQLKEKIHTLYILYILEWKGNSKLKGASHSIHKYTEGRQLISTDSVESKMANTESKFMFVGF